MDVDADAALIVDRTQGLFAGGLQNPYGVRECGDFNGDGYGDLLYDWGQILVYYGGPAVARSGIDLGAPDVEVTYDAKEAPPFSWNQGTFVADWDGDGLLDLAFGTKRWVSTYDSDSKVALFRGGAGFFDRGTVLQLTHPDASVWERENTHFGAALALADDLDGDGRHEILVGDDWSDIGAVYIHHGFVPLGEMDVSDFTDLTWTGAEDGVGRESYKKIGTSILTNGDIDGNGGRDLVLPLPERGSGGAYLILR